MSDPAPPSLQKIRGHKYDHGHVLVLAGGICHSGAARLAARGALRIGAGLVTLAPPLEAMSEHAHAPDALMRLPVDSPTDLRDAIAARRINALAIGPGLGLPRAERLLPVALETGLPVVIDADALGALALKGHLLHDTSVLTPHLGEFARLYPDLAASLPEDPEARRQAALAAARRSGAVMVLKGANTLIAAPDGHSHRNMGEDAPWLATAGSGDVLAGIITGLLARGLSAYDAACTGVAVHTDCARRFGPGLIADDLPGQIPAVLRAMA
ncbi:MAG: NAD(P)H-hydrate dehydratase [Paracoccus sp. (in: a-proteobacteria)]